MQFTTSNVQLAWSIVKTRTVFGPLRSLRLLFLITKTSLANAFSVSTFEPVRPHQISTQINARYSKPCHFYPCSLQPAVLWLPIVEPRRPNGSGQTAKSQKVKSERKHHPVFNTPKSYLKKKKNNPLVPHSSSFHIFAETPSSEEEEPQSVLSNSTRSARFCDAAKLVKNGERKNNVFVFFFFFRRSGAEKKSGCFVWEILNFDVLSWVFCNMKRERWRNASECFAFV